MKGESYMKKDEKKPEEKKHEEKALVQTPPQGTLVPALNSADFESDAGAGFENMGANDMAIPFLIILQSGSPQLKRGESKIEGASEGDIFNTVTGDFYSGLEGIFVIPCTYKKAFVEWTPRDSGGGFVKQYDNPSIMDESTKDSTGKDILPNGNLIVPTAYHYVLIVDPITGDCSECVISMTSTQLKKSRKWNSIMNGLKMSRKDGTKFTPPMFSHMYKITTDPESNELGAWSGWHIEIYSQVPTLELYNAAKKFATNINSGIVKEATPQPTTGGNEPF